MITKRKHILTIIIVIFVTAFLSMTVGNLFMVEIGEKVIIKEADFDRLYNIAKKYEKQEKLMELVQKNFLYEADEETMLQGALEGTLNSLNDPYTQFLSKEKFESLMQDTEGSYEGIGVYITEGEDNKILIVSPIEDTPAEKAGLKTGDKILRINGTDYSADQIDEAVKVMKGMPGTSVTLTISRENKDGTRETTDVVVNREKIRIKTIKPAMLEDNIGYIKITTFDMQTAKDFKEAFNNLKKQGMEKLIIDLRFNPGGIIDTTVNITDIFLEEGIVTYTKTKAGEVEYYKSDAEKEDIPLVVLVNDGSASASEIMAGALKDRERATLIGTKTFGKGIVQRVQHFGTDGEGVKMTVSEYFTPNGINIHKIGIEPDIVIELPEDAVGYGSEYYDTDNQLQKAVEVIRTIQ